MNNLLSYPSISLECKNELLPQITNFCKVSGYLDAYIIPDIPPSLHPNREKGLKFKA